MSLSLNFAAKGSIFRNNSYSAARHFLNGIHFTIPDRPWQKSSMKAFINAAAL
jgi:hypothetical protein